jgi:hypothetical protein
MAFAAVSAVGQVQQGRAARSTANAQAAQDEYQGAVARDNSVAEAQRIQRAGRMARGETIGALAASGVKIGDGSALIDERQVMQDYETDASIALLNGTRAQAAANTSAANTRKAGRNAERAGYISAGTSLLSAGAQSARFSGWNPFASTAANNAGDGLSQDARRRLGVY